MQPSQETTLSQKIAIAANLALFLAMPVIIFLRKKPGYRFLNPVKILVIFFLLLMTGGLSAVTGNTVMVAVFGLFAWTTLITGLVKRQLRWREIKNGIAWHTYSRGVPLLSFVLPFSDTNTKRWIEPVAVLIVGIVVAFLFLWLGLYLILAAFCLFLFEAWDFERALNQMLDMLDSLVDAEVMSANVEYYTSNERPQERPLEETAGIPTGIAPDIAAQVERRRKARQQIPPQDNLAI